MRTCQGIDWLELDNRRKYVLWICLPSVMRMVLYVGWHLSIASGLKLDHLICAQLWDQTKRQD